MPFSKEVKIGYFHGGRTVLFYRASISGFFETGPKGWSMNVVEQQDGTNESLANFSKCPLDSKKSPNPTIFLTAARRCNIVL